MSFAFARASRDAYWLSRMAQQESISITVPVCDEAGTEADPLARFAYRDQLDELDEVAERIHRHFSGCTCYLRGR